MNIEHLISLDMQQIGMTPTIYAKQLDSLSRTVMVSLYSNGAAWNIPADATVIAVGYRKSDGTQGLYDVLPDGTKAVSAAGNIATVHLAPQMFTAAGMVSCELRLTSISGVQISTFSWRMCVEGSAAGNASENYYNLASLDTILEEIGDLTRLDTDDKSNLVAAVNETLALAEVKEDAANKVLALSEHCTDVQYPSAGAVQRALTAMAKARVLICKKDVPQTAVEAAGQYDFWGSPEPKAGDVVIGKNGYLALVKAVDMSNGQVEEVTITGTGVTLIEAADAVTSVNGKTGAVELSARDVGAQPAGCFDFAMLDTAQNECGIVFDPDRSRIEMYTADGDAGMELVGVASPTQDDAAANKGYVDGVVGDLIDQLNAALAAVVGGGADE